MNCFLNLFMDWNIVPAQLINPNEQRAIFNNLEHSAADTDSQIKLMPTQRMIQNIILEGLRFLGILGKWFSAQISTSPEIESFNGVFGNQVHSTGISLSEGHLKVWLQNTIPIQDLSLVSVPYLSITHLAQQRPLEAYAFIVLSKENKSLWTKTNLFACSLCMLRLVNNVIMGTDFNNL